MFKSVASVIAANLVAVGAPALHVPTLAAPLSSDVGGILTQDTTWTAQSGPYNLTSTVQIPAGVTLTIEPGVSVTRNESVATWFLLHGDVEIHGSASEPVQIAGSTGQGTLFMFDHADADVLVEHAEVRDIEELIYTGNGAGSLTITDSRITRFGVRAGAYGFYGPMLIRNNEFINDGSFNVDPRYYPAVFEHNRWIRTTAEESDRPALWLFAGASVNNNTFAGGNWAAIGTLRPFSDMPTTVNVENNYWGTTDATHIASRIYDSNDSISNQVTADFQPFLSAPPPGPLFVPTEPKSTTVTPGDASVSATWLAPASDGGSSVTGYTVTSTPGGRTCTTTGALSCTITGLTNGAAYTFTVTATNAIGDSQPSEPSNTVTPQQATTTTPQPTPTLPPPTQTTTTPTPAPTTTAPSKMRAPKVVVRGAKAIVKWGTAEANGSAITRYLVDISKGKDKTCSPSASNTVFKRLKPGRYRIRLAAQNGVGTSPYSTWVNFRIR